ncbi:pilus assembly protein [Escherichia albertii]
MQRKSLFSKFMASSKGITTIEFAGVFIPFIISILFVAEICREIYVISVVDLVISEQGNVASRKNNYNDMDMKEKINEHLNAWPLIYKTKEINIAYKLYNKVSDVYSEKGADTKDEYAPIVAYDCVVSIPYIFLPLEKNFVVRRKVLYIREHAFDKEED